MTTDRVRLYHSAPKSALDRILREGLLARSGFDDLDLEMRRGVVFCWLRREDDRMSQGGQRPDHVYLEVSIEPERCIVADMEWSSLAMMYRQGNGKPKNQEASVTLAALYRITAVPLAEYEEGIFFTPEVLAKGHIAPDRIRISEDGEG